MLNRVLDFDEQNLIDILESGTVIVNEYNVAPRTIKGVTHYSLEIDYVKLGTNFIYTSTIDNFKEKDNATRVGEHWLKITNR